MLTDNQIKKVALDIIGTIAPEADIENLDPAVRLRDQLDFDSVDFLNFAVALQEQLRVEIPEADYPQLATIEGCIACLKSKTGPQPFKGSTVQCSEVQSAPKTSAKVPTNGEH